MVTAAAIADAVEQVTAEAGELTEDQADAAMWLLVERRYAETLTA